MLQDLRGALLLLRRAKGFTFIATLTLALGIGLATAVFSIVNGALLRDLPYRDPGRLVMILNQSLHERGNNKLFATYADFREYAQRARTLESVAAVTWAVRSPILTGHGAARGTTAIAVSSSFFDLLGAHAALGRTFTASDESGGCAVVLSNAFWSASFGAAPSIVGAPIELDGKPCAVLGVMPKAFSFYPAAAQMWPLILPAETDANHTLVVAIGRLKPGVTPAQNEAELSSLFAALHSGDPWRDFGPVVNALQEQFTWLAGRSLRTTLWILLAAVALVLLIACVNVANLLLGRSLLRAREFAVRTALGGGRARLFRQLLTEAAPLAMLGGAFGVWIAYGAVRYFQSVNPVELPVDADISIDLRVLAFAIAVTALTALVAGTAPAWKASRADLNVALKSAGRGSVRGGATAGRAMAAVEMALSVVLLAGAGLLIESVLRMSSADLGFHPDGVTAMNITLPSDSYKEPDTRRRFYESLERKAAAISGVKSAAVTSVLAPASGGMTTLEIFGKPSPEHARHDVATQFVGADYFRTMDMRVLSGGFTAHTDASRPPETLINQAVAAEYFPDGGAIGSRIRVGDDHEPWLTVAGIVETERRITVYNEMQWFAQPAIYRLADQQPPSGATLVVRVHNGASIGPELHRAVGEIDSSVASGEVETLTHRLGIYFTYPRFRALIFGGFAAFALLLAAVGLNGVLSELVSQRMQEIGVRMALGAKPSDVVRLIIRQGGLPVLVGLAAGIACALWLGRFLSSMLYGVAPGDPATLACVGGILLIVAAAALALPARRAARIDPMEALRD
jgi:putative ABC transport system permease protein